MEESLDYIVDPQDDLPTFRTAVYEPMLARTVLFLRNQFECRYGPRASTELDHGPWSRSGFWASASRRELFHSQIDVVLSRCTRASRTFDDALRRCSEGKEATGQVALKKYKVAEYQDRSEYSLPMSYATYS